MGNKHSLGNYHVINGQACDCVCNKQNKKILRYWETYRGGRIMNSAFYKIIIYRYSYLNSRAANREAPHWMFDAKHRYFSPWNNIEQNKIKYTAVALWICWWKWIPVWAARKILFHQPHCGRNQINISVRTLLEQIDSIKSATDKIGILF